ncbi:hypothetical protein [Saccharothrix luteola]|uniref:hypothetical protein n=1 Tax=Saccharothrix luteola TaxID=2893018 RepID=UPI001E6259A2|nr:hypothetical protein [Saccharothrix luteola]MCC8249790.1 hypothetical protein [Saccharothrix luteola]
MVEQRVKVVEDLVAAPLGAVTGSSSTTVQVRTGVSVAKPVLGRARALRQRM